MKRIDGDYHVGNLFQTGNPLTGQRGTRLDHGWLNAVQEELAGAIESAGIVLDPNDRGQLAQAIRTIALPSFATIAAARAINGAALLPDSVQVVQVNGHTLEGRGGAQYRRVEAEPPHAGKFQDASGQWWVLNEFLVTPQMFGAVADGSTDDQPAITASLAFARHVIVPPGTYHCARMIRLETLRVLELMGGAELVRQKTSPSTDPVIWLRGSGAALRGAGLANSVIKSWNRAPNGVVLVGHWSMNESHGNVTYCTIQNLTISGEKIWGQKSGTLDVALLIQNPQFGGFASYSHAISTVRVQQANYGLWLRGYANANTITDLHGIHIGNEAAGQRTNCFIFVQGALDNTISNAFFHASPNSIGLHVAKLDNVTYGGVLHTPYANTFRGLVFEQGGGRARGLVAESASGASFYEIRHNVAGGNDVPPGFFLGNTLIGLGGTQRFGTLIVDADLDVAGTVTAGALASTGELAVGGALRTGQGEALHLARRVKVDTTPNAATTTFRLSCNTVGGLWRYGFLDLRCSGGDAGGGIKKAGKFYYILEASGTPYPTTLTLVDSAGNATPEEFGIRIDRGIVTVATAHDSLIADATFGFANTDTDIL